MRSNLLAALLLLLPLSAAAHSFGVVYTLPIPFWLYAWGAAAALVASFVVVGLFASGQQDKPAPAAVPAPYLHQLPTSLLVLLQTGSVLTLGLCIATGWWGAANPYANFNMTFFWIVFVLGYAYLTALMGDLYALINPWAMLTGLLSRVWPAYAHGRWAYPARLGYWPATLLYMGFIWFELFGQSKPFSLASALAAYTLLNLIAVFAVGARDWFRYGEFLSVMLRQIARMAPVEYALGTDGGRARAFRLRWPFAGLLQPRDEHPSLLVFVLFMLSSTAYDGLHEAAPWVKLFWVDLYQGALSGWLGINPVAAFPVLWKLYKWWQAAWLLLSPFIYLLIYWAGIALVQRAGGGLHTRRELALRFLPSLLPIVLVYHITHYFTLIQTQGFRIIALASDPFGRGWNLFGTATWFRGAIIPDLTVVWHVQVVLIVLGHILSVYVAHLEALRIYPDRRRATLSQLPMLALMVLFTTAGLWILSQPIKSPG